MPPWKLESNVMHHPNGQRKCLHSCTCRGVGSGVPEGKLIGSRGTKLESSLDVMPWYAGKVDVVRYLEELNKEKQVSFTTPPTLPGLRDIKELSSNGYPRS